MIKSNLVVIDKVNGKECEYLIKDGLGINIGRIFIIEYSRENMYLSCRIKFYKQGSGFYRYLKDTVKSFCEEIFKKLGIKKINIITTDEINTTPFTELGFQLEGIITDSVTRHNVSTNELIFGISYSDFQKNSLVNVLRVPKEDIILKIFTPEDAESLLEYYIRNKEHLKPFEPTKGDGFYTVEFQTRSIEEFYRQYLNGTSMNFGIHKGNKLIGKIQLSNIVMGAFESAFVGYSIDKDEQGNGYMKKSLKILMDYAFNEMNLHRLEATTLVDNFKSQGVLKHCGFKEIGVSEKYLFVNGEWKDHIIFYKINDNYLYNV